MEAGFVTHEFGAFFDKDSRVLILGTIPSPKSREQGFYYGHPQNRFWKVLADVLGEKVVPQTVEERKKFLKRNRIALWDVLESCEIKGASDVSIRNARPNDMNRILQAADIRAIFVAGQSNESAQRPRQHASRADRDAGVHAGGDSRHRQSDEAGRSA